MENDEARILGLLDLPRSKGELSEATGLEDEKISTILQKLKRNGLAQLMEGKRWALTDLGIKRLEELEEEPEEEPEPPHEESLTKRFEINRKKRSLLRYSEELSSILSNWGWEDDLLKDAETLREDVEYIARGVNEIRSMEGFEETEKILEDLNCSFGELLAIDDRISAEKSNQEREEKLGRIREFYTEFYRLLTQEELEELIKKCGEDPEEINDTCKFIEWKENLEYLLGHAFEYEIDPSFVRDVHDMAATEKLELEYVVRLWEDYNLLASRYGPPKAYYFIQDRGRTILKRRGGLWEMFHRYMLPSRRSIPVY